MSVKGEKILSGELAIVNQLLPHRNKWAWELFLKGQQNHWNPADVSMSKDIDQWKDPKSFTDDERLLLKRCLGFFAGSESLVANNLLLGIFRVVSDAECRQYILRQAFEEALHNQTVVYVCDSLDLDIGEVYEAYRTIPSIKAKDDFLMSITTDMGRAGFNITDGDDRVAAVQEVLRNLITYYVICEGLFFYAGFAMLLSFGRRGKLPGLCEQIQYTLRDESVHIQFGTTLIHVIIHQEPEAWTSQFQSEIENHIFDATKLEIEYALDVLPRGILGLNAEMFVDYMKFIANRRFESLGLKSCFGKNPRNPFPWMTETIDLAKQKNFFESIVNEYAAGSLVDDL